MFLGVLPAREAHAHGTSAVGDRERAVRKVVLTVILVGSLLITKEAFPDEDTRGRITSAPASGLDGAGKHDLARANATCVGAAERNGSPLLPSPLLAHSLPGQWPW